MFSNADAGPAMNNAHEGILTMQRQPSEARGADIVADGTADGQMAAKTPLVFYYVYAGRSKSRNN